MVAAQQKKNRSLFLDRVPSMAGSPQQGSDADCCISSGRSHCLHTTRSRCLDTALLTRNVRSGILPDLYWSTVLLTVTKSRMPSFGRQLATTINTLNTIESGLVYVEQRLSLERWMGTFVAGHCLERRHVWWCL